MQPAAQFRNPGDGHLWMIAAGLSLLLNLGFFTFAGLTALNLKKAAASVAPTTPQEKESVATIELIPVEKASAEQALLAQPRSFARTSPDQASTPVEKPAFIGERNTRATSDRAPVRDAPPLPSQAGITPRDDTDFETTESDFKDGDLSANTAPPAAEEIPETGPPAQAPTPPSPATPPAASSPPREALLEGPNPVDVQTPKETTPTDDIKPAVETMPETAAQPVEESPPPSAKSKPRDPAFSGFQRKTAIVGSISRTGRSSLDVEDTALGRYQAAISRAVELEWQRNCVRHRDFITPGFLTVRFFVEPSGKVRSVQFVGDMETGEIQKGFTLNSIRDAAIPPMPAALRREYDQEPLELVFRFYF